MRTRGYLAALLVLALSCVVWAQQDDGETEAAGAAYVALQTAAVERLEHSDDVPPAGPAVLQASVDGAMVPLIKQQWGEAKTLAIGTVGASVESGATPPVR